MSVTEPERPDCAECARPMWLEHVDGMTQGSARRYVYRCAMCRQSVVIAVEKNADLEEP